METPADHLPAFTPTERESFLDAIARHRAAAWRVTAASTFTLAVAVFIVALLSAPLWYGAIALVADLLNLAIPTRNLVGDFMAFWDRWDDADVVIGPMRWMYWCLVAAAPGAVVLAFIALALRRALALLATHEIAALNGKVPHELTLPEQRLRNVIAEMSIAANIQPPSVLIVEGEGHGAGVFGTESAPIVVISRALLTDLNRDELQGVAAHLVASIAQGDLPIGRGAALTLAFFNLMSRLAVVLNEPGAGKALARVFAGLLFPTQARLESVALAIGEAFSTGVGKPKPQTQNWKDYAKLVFAGPVVMLGFFGGIVSFLVLGPLLSLAWRQRKYMADATAVRLTRDPDTLAHALEKISNQGGGSPLGKWTGHLSIAGAHGSRGFTAGNAVPMLPTADHRLRALRKLGATLTQPTKQMTRKQLLIVSALLSVVGALTLVLLPLLMWVSVALSMIFFGLPLSIVHMLLRALGN